MDPDGDFDIDPAIAAAMGFGGFGTQIKGKRKFDSNEGYVDPGLDKTNASHGTGANSLPTRDRKATKVSADAEHSGQQQGGEEHTAASGAATLYDPKTQPSPSLELLRKGVRNTRGDMVYFMPSFLEDPWAKAKGK